MGVIEILGLVPMRTKAQIEIHRNGLAAFEQFLQPLHRSPMLWRVCIVCVQQHVRIEDCHGSLTMLLAFSVFDERFDLVIVQTRLVAHMDRFDPEGTTRDFAGAQQGHTQKLIERLAERKPSGLALSFYSGGNIVVEHDGRSDAHDAYRVASKTSECLLCVEVADSGVLGVGAAEDSAGCGAGLLRSAERFPLCDCM
jgi:hypothetical protein